MQFYFDSTSEEDRLSMFVNMLDILNVAVKIMFQPLILPLNILNLLMLLLFDQ